MTTTIAASDHAFGPAVCHALVRRGHKPANAVRIAEVISRTKAWIDTNAKDAKTAGKGAYDIYRDGKKVLAAGHLMQNQMMAKSLARLSKVQNLAGVSVIRGAIDVAEVVAKRNNVELNQCALSSAKVVLDGVVITGSAATVETGVGAIVFALTLKGTRDDLIELAANCFDAHITHQP